MKKNPLRAIVAFLILGIHAALLMWILPAMFRSPDASQNYQQVLATILPITGAALGVVIAFLAANPHRTTDDEEVNFLFASFMLIIPVLMAIVLVMILNFFMKNPTRDVTQVQLWISFAEAGFGTYMMILLRVLYPSEPGPPA